jgi:iron(III) transport system substrate-binding protein
MQRRPDSNLLEDQRAIFRPPHGKGNEAMKLSRRSGRLFPALVAILGVSLLAGCAAANGAAPGGDATAQSTYEKYAAMSGQERHDALVKAAKEEGQLTVYSTNSVLEKVLGPAFEKEYGIKLNIFRGTTTDVRQRLIQEADANRVQADVVETKESEMELIAQYGGKNLIAPYTGALADSIDDAAKTPHLVASYYIATTPIYNKKSIGSSPFPSSYEDFADPKWANKLAIDQGDVNWYQDLYNYYTGKLGWSDDKFVTMAKAIVANARVVDGHVSNTELLRAGDFSVFLSDFMHYVPKDDSGPIAFDPAFEPVTLQLVGPAPLTGAKHPAAALLFMDFYLTEGQKMLDDAGFIPTNPSEIPGYKARLSPDAATISDDWKSLSSADGTAWQHAFDNLLKGIDPVLPQ